VYGADDVLTLNHGLQHKGQVVELGGNSVELVVPGGGNRKILKRDIREVAFDKTRRQATVHDTDAVVIKGGHRIPGKVEIVDNGRGVRVTLEKGGTALFRRNEVVVIMKGDREQLDSSVFTIELDAAIQEAMRGLQGSEEARREGEKLLARVGVFAIYQVREAALTAPPGSAEFQALQRIDRLYRLKENVATQIEEGEARVYEILSSGTLDEKRDLLSFIFPRFVDDSVPLAVCLATDSHNHPAVRGWSIDFLRRLQRNRELLDIYRKSAGQIQLASAVALGKNRIHIGIPTLIEALAMDSLPMRELAVENLREWTGKNFRFRADGAPHSRKEAVDKWWAWWQEEEDSVVAASTNALHQKGADSSHRRAAVDLWEEAGAEAEAERYPQAEKLLREALDLDPSFFQPYLALAVLLYTHLERPEEATNLLLELKTRRMTGEDRVDRQWICLHLGHSWRLTGEFEKSLEEYLECRALAAENLQCLLGLADVAFALATSAEEFSPELRKDRLNLSLRSCRESTAVMDKLTHDLAAMRAEAVEATGGLPFARRDYNRSVFRLRRTYRAKKLELSFQTAKVLAIQGDKKPAMLTLRQLVKEIQIVDGEFKNLEARARCYLALLYEDVGRPLLALKQFRKVLDDLDPEHSESLRGIKRLRRRGQGAEAGLSN
jgi:tetratricopeptide (TPR) repeat protein